MKIGRWGQLTRVAGGTWLILLRCRWIQSRRRGVIWQDRGWPEAAEGLAAVTSIMRTQQILLARIETVLKPHGLTFARFELLAHRWSKVPTAQEVESFR